MDGKIIPAIHLIPSVRVELADQWPQPSPGWPVEASILPGAKVIQTRGKWAYTDLLYGIRVV
jgi:hypothetical protein